MDLKKFRIISARKRKPLTAFLLKLDKIVPEDMPKVVAKVDATVWKDVNCMECANCCKTMTPTFTKKDIKRISGHLGMQPKEFIDKWLKKGNTFRIQQNYQNIANDYARLGNIPKAMEYCFKVLKMLEGTKNVDDLNNCYQQIAGYYMLMNDYTKSLILMSDRKIIYIYIYI